MMENQVANYPRLSKQEVPFPVTMRPVARAINTSSRAGKTMPGGFIPLMPKDSIMSGSMARIMVSMEATEKLLSNQVIVRARAHFVSYAALERFEGRDSVAFAWAEKDGYPDIVSKIPYSDAQHEEFFKTFGLHFQDGDEINDLYLRAYNCVINYQRRLVSKSLPERGEVDTSIARSLWGQTAIARIVPDWDNAALNSSVQLSFDGSSLPLNVQEVPVDGYFVRDQDDTTYFSPQNPTGTVQDPEGDGTTASQNKHGIYANRSVSNTDQPLTAVLDGVVAQLTGGAGSISLAQLDQAKRVKAFADLRSRMAGTDDELIDLLMRGIPIPNAGYYDPMLIGSAVSSITQMQRYATDAENLDEYVANGSGGIDIPLRLPEQDTGGVVVITYDIVPEPVFDRQSDMFLHMDFDDLPNALRDNLDTQPVQVVTNRFVDARHSAPDETFGFAPMNMDWAQRTVGMGGRFYRDATADESDEDQQHVWSVRQVDPVLDEHAFLVPSDLSHNVFFDTTVDPFFVRVEYGCQIRGITQFGPSLYESSGDYEAVVAEIPVDDLASPSE